MLSHKQFEFSVPGKAFIAGEYLALAGGPALVAAVAPRFQLHVRPSNLKEESPFHKNSLAGAFWKLNEDLFSKYELDFKDPHQGAGGWGGSSAEFALLHAAKQVLQSGLESCNQISSDLVWSDYRQLSEGGPLLQRPSGADLVGQLQGGLTLFHRQQMFKKTFFWNFKNIGLLLFRTNQKLATHTHLQSLKDFSTAELNQAMDWIISSFESTNSEMFVEGISHYAQALKGLGFVAESTQKYLNQIDFDGVLAAKGCGAMGADVLAVVYEKTASSKKDLLQSFKNLGLQFIADETSLSDGIFFRTKDFLGFSKSTLSSKTQNKNGDFQCQ